MKLIFSITLASIISLALFGFSSPASAADDLIHYGVVATGSESPLKISLRGDAAKKIYDSLQTQATCSTTETTYLCNKPGEQISCQRRETTIDLNYRCDLQMSTSGNLSATN